MSINQKYSDMKFVLFIDLMLAAILTTHVHGVPFAVDANNEDSDPEMMPSYYPEQGYSEEGWQGGQLTPEESWYPELTPAFGDEATETEPEMHHRRKRRRCRDKARRGYCARALNNGICQSRRKKKCRKTCGICNGRKECKDSMLNCVHASIYTCSLDWFARGCKKSCNLCQPKTTIQPVITTTTLKPEECRDLTRHCENANQYTCSISWFQWGCRRSCNLCKPETTSQPVITTPEPEECRDLKSNCEIAKAFTCSLFWFRRGCKKSCGECVPEQTTTEPITSTASTTQATTTPFIPSTASTTQATTTPFIPSTASTTRATTTPFIPSTASTTQATTTQSIPSTVSTTQVTTTTEPSPETTAAVTTQSTLLTAQVTTEAETDLGTTTTNPNEGTSKPTEEAILCVDQDEKNCHVWESLGLCYNPEYMEDTIKLCPLSCKACDPEEMPFLEA